MLINFIYYIMVKLFNIVETRDGKKIVLNTYRYMSSAKLQLEAIRKKYAERSFEIEEEYVSVKDIPTTSWIFSSEWTEQYENSMAKEC